MQHIQKCQNNMFKNLTAQNTFAWLKESTFHSTQFNQFHLKCLSMRCFHMENTGQRKTAKKKKKKKAKKAKKSKKKALDNRIMKHNV